MYPDAYLISDSVILKFSGDTTYRSASGFLIADADD